MRLAPGDEAEITRLLARCFNTEFGGRSYFMQRHHLRLVARDPHIVGHVGLAFRSVRQDERLIPVVGLGDVATDPDRRGQGIASALLQAAIEEAAMSPADFMLLFGDAALYAGHGFRPASNPLRYVDLTDARTGAVCEGPDASLMVLPVRGADWATTAPTDLLGNKF